MGRSDQGQPTLAILLDADHVLGMISINDLVVRLAEQSVVALKSERTTLQFELPDLVFDVSLAAKTTLGNNHGEWAADVIAFFDALFEDFAAWRRSGTHRLSIDGLR